MKRTKYWFVVCKLVNGGVCNYVTQAQHPVLDLTDTHEKIIFYDQINQQTFNKLVEIL